MFFIDSKNDCPPTKSIPINNGKDKSIDKEFLRKLHSSTEISSRNQADLCWRSDNESSKCSEIKSLSMFSYFGCCIIKSVRLQFDWYFGIWVTFSKNFHSIKRKWVCDRNMRESLFVLNTQNIDSSQWTEMEKKKKSQSALIHVSKHWLLKSFA